jgi:hypothetical protein
MPIANDGKNLSNTLSQPTAIDEDIDMSVNDIANVVPQDLNPYQKDIYNQVRQFNDVIPVQAHSTYFPSAGVPINKGSYSGSVVGNVPIFAPSMMAPVGVFDAKRQALKAAADAKVKEIDDFTAMYGKAPETSRKAVQEQLDNGYYDWLTQWQTIAQQRYGEDWVKHLRNDTQFLKEEQSWNTLAQYNTQLVDQVAGIQAQIKTGDFVADPMLLASMNAVMSGVDGLATPGSKEAGALSQNVLKMQAFYDLDTAVNTSLDELIQDVYETNPGIDGQGIYDVLTTTKVTGTDKNKIQALSDSLYDSRYAGGSYITRDMIQRNIEAKLGKKVERTVQTQANQFSNAGGAYDTYQDSDLEAESTINTTQASGSEGRFKDAVLPTTTYAGVTFKKPITTMVAQGESMTNMSNGSVIKAPGSVQVTWGESRVVPVRRDPAKSGSVVVLNDAQIEGDGRLTTGVEYMPMAFGEYTVPAATPGDPPQVVKVAKPTAELSNAMVSKWNPDGTVARGVPIDKQQAKADELNKSNGYGAYSQQAAAPASASAFDAKWAALPSGGSMEIDGRVYTKK